MVINREVYKLIGKSLMKIGFSVHGTHHFMFKEGSEKMKLN